MCWLENMRTKINESEWLSRLAIPTIYHTNSIIVIIKYNYAVIKNGIN